MRTIWQDIRYGVRVLMKNPGFTFVAVLTLTLGIGANTAIFSVVNAVLLRPLPYKDPERIVRIGGANARKNQSMTTFSPQDFYDWRERNRVFENIAVYDEASLSLTGAGEPERLRAARVSPGFFPILRVAPALGRDFLPEEEKRGNHQVVILSHGLWQRRFGAEPNVIGGKLTLSGTNFTVVGVMPASFEAPRLSASGLTTDNFAAPDLWVPFAPDLTQWTRGGRSIDAAIGRLKDGVSLAQAAAEMNSIGSQLERQYPDSNAGYGIGVVSLHEQYVGGARKALLIFLVAVGFVLLIACANVANLLLARAAGRQKEIAIRTALGAKRSRVVRQLLTESVMLAVGGGALGLLIALWATDSLVALGSGAIPVAGEIKLDGRVLGFTAAASLLTGILFGLVPALQASKPDLTETLKDGGKGATSGAGRGRVRSLLVVSEVALSLVLLVGAGLLVKSFLRLQAVDPGFNTKNLLTMSVFLPGAKYPEDYQHAAFFERTLAEIRTLPGVESASVVSNLPISGDYDRMSLYVEGQPVPPAEEVPDVERYMIDPDYFKTLGIPFDAGRSFVESDNAEALKVAIINESFVRRYFNSDENALGKRIKIGEESNPWMLVIGVVGDVKHYGLDAPATQQVYLPIRQSPAQGMTLVVRTAAAPETAVAAVRNRIWAVDKDQPVYNIKPMEQFLSESVAKSRFSTSVLGIFATVALLLAAVGLYGVMAYSVAQRRREIGIRVALGAEPRDMLRLVVGQGLKLTLTGIAVGLAGAFAITRVLASLLYGVATTDPATFVAVSLLLAAVAFLACYIPARRAMNVDPVIALRHE